MADLTYSQNFKYTHNNPYHDRLEKFSDFVLRDKEGEQLKGHWNQKVFQREAPLIVEVGTGYGKFMREFSQNNPQVNFLGIDYRFKRSFHLAKKLNEHPVKNFRYLRARGERLSFLFEESELDGLFYFFPDPWPKTRHNKKRLFQLPFLKSAYQVLKPGGTIFVKTDHQDYFDWMRKCLANQNHFKVVLSTDDLWHDVNLSGHLLCQYETKFEKIFRAQGIKIKAFVLASTKER